MRPFDWKKYLIVFLITGGIFAVGFYLSDYFNTKKIDQINSTQDKISVDILSSETQFSLLQELSCSDVTKSILSQELNSLSDKIEYSEKNISGNTDEINTLKKYYSLLEIKDYLLMKKATERCGLQSVFLLYFYINSDACTECNRQSLVLSKLREEYPGLRVYSFDYNLDMSAIRAMVSIYKVPEIFPGFIINGKSYTGYKSFEEIETIIKPLLIKEDKETKKTSTQNVPVKPPAAAPETIDETPQTNGTSQ